VTGMSGVIIEPVTGRYMHLEIHGQPHRLYWEEAGPTDGSGIPLVCLHTAGSDGRQFRALLNDGDITAKYRVIVFDMPWHGKSSPPAGWQDEEYKLTTEKYVELVCTVVKALKLDRPVAMGCSIGGRVVLELARAHADLFRAVIGLQSSAFVQHYFDITWLHRPNIHGGEMSAAYCYGLVGPEAPLEHRWETLWHYMQGGPGVFKGDLHFYSVDGDVSGTLPEIDTSACPVYLLTGEYDYSCTPEASQLTADKIDGAQLTIMERLGHFPMSEDPDTFKTYLLPVLDGIADL
jgi:pimeloyl-ACP methyl ester carboxylesterase